MHVASITNSLGHKSNVNSLMDALSGNLLLELQSYIRILLSETICPQAAGGASF